MLTSACSRRSPRIVYIQILHIRISYNTSVTDPPDSGLKEGRLPAALTEFGIARAVDGFSGARRLELIDGDEPGLRLRIGDRAAKWSVMTPGPTGERIRMP